MAAPPNRTELVDTQPNPSNGVFKGGIGKLYDYVTGLLGATGDAADARNALGIEAAFPAGTRMLFQQSAAPTGWTKLTDHDNKALRIVSGAAGSGGSVDFTTAFANGSVGNTTLTQAQMPNHTHATHSLLGYVGSGGNLSIGSGINFSDNQSRTSAGTGGGGSHTHSLSLAVKYVDSIIAQKD